MKHAEAAAATRRDPRFVCHELRGALQPMGVWASMLAGGHLDAEEARRTGVALQNAVDLLSRLVGDLFVIEEAAGHQQFSLERRPIDLRESARAALVLLEAAAAQKGVSLHAEMAAEPVLVNGDHTRLCQVAVNLIDNGLKFTEAPGQVLVRVSVEAGAASLTVTDTGRGIRPEFLGQLFRPFSRDLAEPAGSGGPPPGLGLGLVVVKELVLAHGGSVRVERAGRGRGTRVVVTLACLAEPLP